MQKMKKGRKEAKYLKTPEKGEKEKGEEAEAPENSGIGIFSKLARYWVFCIIIEYNELQVEFLNMAFSSTSYLSPFKRVKVKRTLKFSSVVHQISKSESNFLHS